MDLKIQGLSKKCHFDNQTHRAAIDFNSSNEFPRRGKGSENETPSNSSKRLPKSLLAKG